MQPQSKLRVIQSIECWEMSKSYKDDGNEPQKLDFQIFTVILLHITPHNVWP